MTADSTHPKPARLLYRPSWHGEDGTRRLLLVSGPLILASLSAALNLFMDRWFLARYDAAVHLPAAMSAGTLWWTLSMFGFGIVSYVATFVAQYHGANRPERIGHVVWQSIYLSLIFGVAMLGLIPLAGPLFDLIGKPGEIPAVEADHFRPLCWANLALFLNVGIGGLWAGRGKTWFVMAVNFVVVAMNIPLNYWFIYHPPEALPFIHGGANGAAWGTVVSIYFGTVIYLVAFFSKGTREAYATVREWHFDRALFARLVRYGWPQSLQSFVEVASFTVFLNAMGKVDMEALAATTIALSVNMVIFIPIIGMGQGIGVLAGQFIGSGQAARAEKTTWQGNLLATGSMVLLMGTFLFFPEMYLAIFKLSESQVGDIGRIRELATFFLMLIGVYCTMDAIGQVYAGAIKGAGDTAFVAWSALIFGTLFLILPSIAAVIFGWPAPWMWAGLIGYITVWGLSMLWRYRGGKWKAMQVIEADMVTRVVAKDELEAASAA
ncbi:MAG: MATE family efflux transporter [Sumerlaeia bacterium]